MRNIWTIAQKEYRAYFSSFTAYLFAFVMLLVVGVLTSDKYCLQSEYFRSGSTPRMSRLL